MMAERLARLKESLDDPNLAYFEPCVVRELLDHIAQLEAQRGANVLATCANCAQRGHCVHAKLGEACEDHIVQRGGAVVVPTKMDDDDWEAIGFQQSTEGQLQRVWDRAVSRIQPIPADRVPVDGMVGVDREEVERLSKAITDVAKSSIHYPIGSVGDRAVDALCEAFAPIWSTIRSAKGGEG